MTEKHIEHENTKHEKASVNVLIPDKRAFKKQGILPEKKRNIP